MVCSKGDGMAPSLHDSQSSSQSRLSPVSLVGIPSLRPPSLAQLQASARPSGGALRCIAVTTSHACRCICRSMLLSTLSTFGAIAWQLHGCWHGHPNPSTKTLPTFGAGICVHPYLSLPLAKQHALSRPWAGQQKEYRREMPGSAACMLNTSAPAKPSLHSATL